jgi:hypothetical protein
MKKTLTLLLAAVAAFSMTAANFLTVDEADMGTPVKMENVKKAPAGMQEMMMEKFAAKIKTNFPVTTTDDLVGAYTWTFRQYTGGFTSQPDTISNEYTFQRDTVDNVQNVLITKFDEDSVRVNNFMPLEIGATFGETSGYKTLTFSDTETVYNHSTYGACTLAGVWYYEGDDTYSAGWYYGDVMGYVLDEGILMDPEIHFYMIIKSGTYANYRLGWIYEPNSVMIPDDSKNAIMQWTYNSSVYKVPVAVTEDENYKVTVTDFAGVAVNPVYIQLAADNTWEAEQTVLYTSSQGYNYTLCQATSPYGAVTGTGTEKVLTFDGSWTGLDQEAGYWIGSRTETTITLISDDEFVYPGEEPQPVEEGFFLVGTFNDWNQTEEGGRLAFDENDMLEGVEFEAGAEFKVIAFDENGTVWFGGQDDNNVGYFLINNDVLGQGVMTIQGDSGANFRIEEAGTYNIELAVLREFSGAVLMKVTKDSPQAISTVGVDTKADNAYYNLMGVKFNSMPTVPGIYIHNGKKVIIK